MALDDKNHLSCYSDGCFKSNDQPILLLAFFFELVENCLLKVLASNEIKLDNIHFVQLHKL